MKRYHVSKNLFNTFDIVGQVPSVSSGALVNSPNGATNTMIELPAAQCILTATYTTANNLYLFLYDENSAFIGYKQITAAGSINSNTITGYSAAKYARVRVDNLSTFIADNGTIMLNKGSTALSFEPYGNEWQTKSPPNYGTATDAVTSLPVEIFTDGQPIAANLLNPDSKTTNEQGAERYGDSFPAGTYYILNNTANNVNWRDGISTTATHAIAANTGEVVTTSSDLVVWHFNRETAIMVAKSSVAIPFQPYAPWGIKGNTETGENPSPQNPITINGVGEKTVNLYNGGIKNGGWSATTGTVPTSNASTERLGTDAIFALDSTKTYTITVFPNTLKIAVMSLDDNNKMTSDSGWSTNNYQTISGASAIVASIKNATGTAISLNDCEGIVIVEGTSPPASYEPFGYKIPLSSNGTALSPIYLTNQLMKIGDTADSLVSTGTVTYSIKKLVLTGGPDESWNTFSLGTAQAFFILQNISMGNATVLSSHFAQTGIYTTNTAVGIDTSGTTIRFRPPNVATDFTTRQDWLDWLAAQYSAGTPVIVYYILATPTTETVTVPSIPTIGGTATIDVDTTVKPSEFDLTYHGWHEHQPKKKSANLLDMSQSVYGEGLTAGIGATTPTFAPSAATSHSGMIKVKSNTEYTIKLSEAPTTARSIYMYDSSQEFVRVYPTQQSTISLTITTGATEEYIIFGYNIDDTQAMLVEGPTAPSEFAPYWE